MDSWSKPWIGIEVHSSSRNRNLWWISDWTWMVIGFIGLGSSHCSWRWTGNLSRCRVDLRTGLMGRYVLAGNDNEE